MNQTDGRSSPGSRENAPMRYANSISETLMASGDFAAAEKVCRETLRLCASSHSFTGGSSKAVAIAHGTLANLLLRRGLHEEAEEHYTNALVIYKEVADESEGIGITHANLGALYEARGSIRKAAECWTLSREVFSRIGDLARCQLVESWLVDLEQTAQCADDGERRRVLISVKYNHDHVIERSLAAYLKRSGYETFEHEGTTDIANRMDLPPFIVDGPLTLMAPSLLPSGRQTEPRDVSSALIRYLVEQVCSHSLVVIVWSAPYAGSFWCQLELQAAILARKPLVVIYSDYHPLPSDTAQAMQLSPCETMEIGDRYRTSGVFAAIERLLPAAKGAATDIESVARALEEFTARNYRDAQATPSVRGEERVRYEDVVRTLREADRRGELRPMIASLVGTRALEYPEPQRETLLATQRLLQSGRADVDVGLRRYLEGAASGDFDAEFERGYYTHLLCEVLDFRFLPPELPLRLEQYYVTRIRKAFDPPKQDEVQSLIDDLIQECLYTREFIEHFGHLLADVRETCGPLVADTYWKLCTARVSETI